MDYIETVMGHVAALRLNHSHCKDYCTAKLVESSDDKLVFTLTQDHPASYVNGGPNPDQVSTLIESNDDCDKLDELGIVNHVEFDSFEIDADYLKEKVSDDPQYDEESDEDPYGCTTLAVTFTFKQEGE